jgi:hypothetical protein
MDNRVELLSYDVGIRERICEQNLICVKAEAKDIFHHELGLILAEVQRSQSRIRHRQELIEVGVCGPKVGDECIELTYLSIGKAGFDLFPRPMAIQTEYFTCSIQQSYVLFSETLG